MLCQICTKKEATIIITKIVGGKKTEFHLCKDCAAAFSDKFSIFPLPQFDINDLLTGLLKAIDLYNKEEGIVPVKEIKCGNCNLTYDEFKVLFDIYINDKQLLAGVGINAYLKKKPVL